MSFDGGAPKQGMGSGAKVLIILGIVAGVAVLACCGAGGLFVYKMKPNVTQAPEEVAARSNSIIPMDIDQEKWEPKFGMEMEVPFIMEFQMAHWSSKADDGGMLLTRVQLKVEDENASQEEIDAQLEQSFSQGGADQDGQMPSLKVDRSEDKEMTILGEKATFRYIEGKRSNSDTEWRELKGHVRRGQDIIVIRIQLEAENYNEEEIVGMLESAK